MIAPEILGLSLKDASIFVKYRWCLVLTKTLTVWLKATTKSWYVGSSLTVVNQKLAHNAICFDKIKMICL